MIRTACIFTTAIASGSALAGIYLGAATVFGIALAIAVAAGLGADLASARDDTGQHEPRERSTT